jgi:glycogen phosphorylase
MNLNYYLPRPLPEELRGLAVLALDLRWSWNHAADALWETVDPELWRATGNPWLILGSVSQVRLAELTRDPHFLAELRRQLSMREDYLAEPTWFAETYKSTLGTIAYFSMEFGLSEALPIYSGGLGILAGDFLKTASDLGVPMVGVGLLYDRGYFRQSLDASGEQLAFYPYNEPHLMPLSPLRDESDQWLKVTVELPGRTLHLLAWVVQVGRVTLYLLDSNDPLNSPRDRGITGELYGGSPELRLQQELVLGIGGWRLLEKLNIDCRICHLNEGHAAFAALERIRSFMMRTRREFEVALHSTRPGNIFTTHTSVPAAFDSFPVDLVRRYGRKYAEQLGLEMEQLIGLGRINQHEAAEPFNMAYLALRCCGRVNAVSRLHAEVSRQLFQPLFERWPRKEVPISYVTNGVHMPTWDSAVADTVWTENCGKRRWVGTLETVEQDLSSASDEALWTMRAQGRATLVKRVRARVTEQRSARGEESAANVEAGRVLLDHNALTIGLARRFTGYKRPALLLHDQKRLTKILTDGTRPVQLLVAGKAHPLDLEGARMVREWVEYLRRPGVCRRAVFLEDYDMAMAAELVQGVDLWINTPRRPWEACGTSGMKVLVNGGLNLSELDGWWAEAYSPDVGWALGDGKEHGEPEWDAHEADELYSLLEQEVIPTFYERDERGIPRRWVAKMRASMAQLTSRFSSNRMVREYTESYYVPATTELASRTAAQCEVGAGIERWRRRIAEHWATLHFGSLTVCQSDAAFTFNVQVYLGEIEPTDVQVELWAEPTDGRSWPVKTMDRAEKLVGASDGFIYRTAVSAERPASHYTPRIVPRKTGVKVPLESSQILWFR